MSLVSYHNTAILQFDDGTTGNAGADVPVTIRIPSTNAKADIFDIAGNPVVNPIKTDSLGNYAFRAENGEYDIIINEGGNPTTSFFNVSIGVGASANITLQELILLSLPENSTANTNGFYTPSDGGESEYEIVTEIDFGGPADEVVNHTLANGNIAKLVFNNKVNCIQIGCQTDGTDQGPRLQTGLEYLNGKCKELEMIRSGDAPYTIQTNFEVPKEVILTGYAIDWINGDVFKAEVVGDFAITCRGSAKNISIDVVVAQGRGINLLDTPSFFSNSWVKITAEDKTNSYGVAIGDPDDLTVATGACYYATIENVRTRAFDSCMWLGPYANQCNIINVQCVNNQNDSVLGDWISTHGIECYGRGNVLIGGGVESQFVYPIAFRPSPTAVPAQLSVQNLCEGLWLEPSLDTPEQIVYLDGFANVIKNVRDGGINYRIERPESSRYCEFISPHADSRQTYMYQVTSDNLIPDAGFKNTSDPGNWWGGLGAKAIGASSFRNSNVLEVTGNETNLTYAITNADDIALLKGKSVCFSCTAKSELTGNNTLGLRIVLLKRFNGVTSILFDSERAGSDFGVLSTTTVVPEDIDQLWCRFFRPNNASVYTDSFTMPSLTIGTQQAELVQKPIYDSGGLCYGDINVINSTVKIDNSEIYHAGNYPPQLLVSQLFSIGGDVITEAPTGIFFNGTAPVAFNTRTLKIDINASTSSTFQDVPTGFSRGLFSASGGKLQAQPSTGALTSDGIITAQGFVTFTGIHFFYSESHIEVGLAVDIVDCEEREISIISEVEGVTTIEEIKAKTNGKVSVSNNESTVCAGVTSDCIPIVGGFLIHVAAVGDNRSGKLKGFKIDSCNPGDILCTSSGGTLKVAPHEIAREVVTFKAMSSPVNGVAYGYF